VIFATTGLTMTASASQLLRSLPHSTLGFNDEFFNTSRPVADVYGGWAWEFPARCEPQLAGLQPKIPGRCLGQISLSELDAKRFGGL
jgi:hypothetical protein